MTLESQNLLAQLQIARNLMAQALATQDAILAAYDSPVTVTTPVTTNQTTPVVQAVPTVTNTETSQPIVVNGPTVDGDPTPITPQP